MFIRVLQPKRLDCHKTIYNTLIDLSPSLTSYQNADTQCFLTSP